MSSEHAPDLGVTQARQGRRGRHALMVLAASTVLVVLALFGAWAFYSGDLARGHGNKEAPPEVARSFDQTPAPVRQSDQSRGVGREDAPGRSG